MRFIPEIFEKVDSARFVGPSRPNGRVTVEPRWNLNTTPPAYGTSIRGPFRYYTNSLQEEYEIPSIRTIQWNRSKGQDVASCTVTIYNTWHEFNSQTPEQLDKLGKPGYFWPRRGTGDSAATWDQAPGTGAYRKSGEWNSAFSWANVLMEDALIRTYEGYGGAPTKGNYTSIDDNLEHHNVVITGVWMVDTVTGGSDGSMTLTCRDVGRLLLDQIVFPPLIPGALYPLEYTVAGKSAFDSHWGPNVKTGVSPASKGEVRVTPYGYSGSGDSSVASAYPLSNCLDGNIKTITLSEAYSSSVGYDPPYTSTAPPPAVYFDFAVTQNVDSISFMPWAGGYTCYVSVMRNGAWTGSQAIPVASPRNINYHMKINVPQYIPDGFEQPLNIDITGDNTFLYPTQRIRITFTDLYYSQIPNGSGHHYRGGLRNFIAYKTGAKSNEYSTDPEGLPWTTSMAAHPTRGYWIAEHDGTVHGLGDAENNDSTLYGPVPVGDYGSNNQISSIAGHPSGEGYWVMDWMGHVWAYGDATDYDEYPVPDPYVGINEVGKVQARDLAPTHTGNGYWVLYTNGIIRGFGDATPSYTVIPQTPVATYMDTYLRNNYAPGRYMPYNILQKATAIVQHPHKMGFWVTDGSGQVFAYGACQHKGQLTNRVYRQGMADTFTMETFEWVTAIESTDTGEGYWILFPTGKIAMFGDAIDKGPVMVKQDLYYDIQENKVPDNVGGDLSKFRDITWSIARDPDGSGFWVLRTSGDVLSYDAEFWGQPGYHGLTGYRWHEGNFSGEWSDIVKDLLMWSGFLYRNGNTIETGNPSVLGRIESTGIKTDTNIPGDRFDKKTVMDAIKEVAEVTAYDFRISEEGGVVFESPNWWRAGNFDQDGQDIFVSGSSYDRVDEDDEFAQPFIPEIHEDLNLFTYAATLSGADKRTEYIIGTDAPSPKDPTRTGFIRHIPPGANEQVSPGILSTRGVVRPAIWVSQLFENEEEAKLMAELIGIHAWFSQRTGSTSCVANPCLSVGDQIRIVEQNSSETFIHLITSIDSNMDLDSGSYQMNISSHWLGSADDWAITADPSKGSDSRYVVISERLDSWQSRTGRKLGSGSAANGQANRTSITGEFDASVLPAEDNAQWGVWAEAPGQSGVGDSTDHLNTMIYGNGVAWPFDSADGVVGDGGLTLGQTILAAQNTGKDLVLTVATGPVGMVGSGGGPMADPTIYAAKIVEILDAYQIQKAIIWQDMTGIGYDSARYVTFFDTMYQYIKENAILPVQIYGPNVNLADRNQGYDTLYNGVSIDSRDMAMLTDFVDDALIFDGIAVSGDFTDTQWANLVDYIKSNVVESSPLIVSLKNGTSGSPMQLHDRLGLADMALWPSSEAFSRPYNPADTPNWVFEGTITAAGPLPSFRVTTEKLSAPLGTNTFIEIYQGGSLIINQQLGGVNETVNLGNLGSTLGPVVYTYRVHGIPTATGNGRLKLNFNADTIQRISVEDNLIIAGS